MDQHIYKIYFLALSLYLKGQMQGDNPIIGGWGLRL
jgi:hypothetical protein